MTRTGSGFVPLRAWDAPLADTSSIALRISATVRCEAANRGPRRGTEACSWPSPATHPINPRRSEKLWVPPGCRPEFLAGESLDSETPVLPFARLPAKAGRRAERSPEGYALLERPSVNITEPSLPIDPRPGTSEDARVQRTVRPCARPSAVARGLTGTRERTSSEVIGPEGPCPSAGFPSDRACLAAAPT